MADMNRVPEVVITPRYLRRLACVWSLELLNEFKIGIGGIFAEF